MIIGHSHQRVGAREKVLGQTHYGFDLGRPGDLFLACLRATKAPARILEIDVGPALACAGVVRVFTARDIPGQNCLGIIPVTKDQEFLAGTVVRHVGQAVALVAAESREAALAGTRAIKVKLEDLPGVFDPEEALSDGAPLVHPDRPAGNLLAERRVVKGDAEAALARSAAIVESEYSTQMVTHASLEMEGGRAEWHDGRIVIRACTQNPHYDQEDIARFLGVAPDRVRVIQAETGGGFGGKLDLSVQPYLALATWHLKRPTRMAYTREESFLATAKRHPFRMRYITGADSQGCLTAMKIDLLADTGAFASYGLAVAIRAAVHATGPYYVPNVAVRCRLAYTNNAWTGAMRGFGVPQVALAHEGQMDALAAKLGLDAWEIRLKNVLIPGQETATGQRLTRGVGLRACLERIKPIYQHWKKTLRPAPEHLAGIGLGVMFYGIGNTGVSNPSTAQVEWQTDGRVMLYTGAAEIGQGSDTVLCQLAAARLGLNPEDIDLCRADTDKTTSAGATSASRQTYISGNAVLMAADNLLSILKDQAGKILDLPVTSIDFGQGCFQAADGTGRAVAVREVVAQLKTGGQQARGHGRFDPEATSLNPRTGQGHPYAAYAFAAQCARVLVDTKCGLVRVTDVAAAHDVGRAINPRGVRGQICGGVLMGLGMALMEEYQHGQTLNFQNYHLPTALDAPRIIPLIVEEPEDTGPFGAKGVGEPALIPTAPAIAGAVSQALGRPVGHLPISLERVTKLLDEREGGR